MNLIQPSETSGFAEDAPKSRRSVQVGLQTLVLDDALAFLGTLPDKSVDAIVTSPPYNLGIRYGTHADNSPRPAYLSWMAKVAAELKRVLSTQGSLFLNVGSSSADPWITYDVANLFRQQLVLQNDIKWVKSVTVNGRTSGHFKPLNSSRFLHHNHETVWHFTLDGTVKINRLAIGVPYTDKSNIARRGHAHDLRCDGNVWFIPYKTVKSKAQKYNHPAGFPLELPCRCLRLADRLGGVALDPFAGTGTTNVAAQRLGMHCIGIDIDRDYLNTAFKRLRDECAP